MAGKNSGARAKFEGRAVELRRQPFRQPCGSILLNMRVPGVIRRPAVEIRPVRGGCGRGCGGFLRQCPAADVPDLVSPVAPARPDARSGHIHHLRGHHVLVGNLLLYEEVLVLRVSDLIADVGEVIFAVGINVEDLVVADGAVDGVGLECGERLLALGCVGRNDAESGGGQELFVAFIFGLLDGGASGEEGGGEGEWKECFHGTGLDPRGG